MPSIDITRAHTGGSCRRIRITQVAGRGSRQLAPKYVRHEKSPIPTFGHALGENTRWRRFASRAAGSNIATRWDAYRWSAQTPLRWIRAEFGAILHVIPRTDAQSPEPHPVGLPYAVKSRRTASNTPLMNDTDSSPENCRANSSASSITTAGGAPALVIS